MTLLLTSFRTWLPHHKSNSSDDLLEIVSKTNKYRSCYLRKLPVEIEAASLKAIAKIQSIEPSAIICCGMAESRSQLTIESHARSQQNCIQTNVNLSQLISQLSHTAISYDAGKFVCEGLYYRVLSYLQAANLLTPAIFVHIPTLTEANISAIERDFSIILDFLGSLEKNCP